MKISLITLAMIGSSFAMETNIRDQHQHMQTHTLQEQQHRNPKIIKSELTQEMTTAAQLAKNTPLRKNYATQKDHTSALRAHNAELKDATNKINALTEEANAFVTKQNKNNAPAQQEVPNQNFFVKLKNWFWGIFGY